MQVTNNKAEVRYLTVDQDISGQRIDNFLLNQLAGVPKGLVYRLIRTGQVRVNGGRVRATHRLQSGDRVRIPPVSVPARDHPVASNALMERLVNSVIYEDDQTLVINKPRNLPVHAGSGHQLGIVETLRQHVDYSGQRLELAHRLDLGTSGCLVIGKGVRAARLLQDQFRHRQVLKQYRVLVAGNWQWQQLRVDKPLATATRKDGERIVQIDASGRVALTVFTRLRYFDQLDATELSADLFTGRKHQIRVHCASHGHAVIGDRKYGLREINKRLKKRGLARMYLHCEVLDFRELDLPRFEVSPDSDWLPKEICD